MNRSVRIAILGCALLTFFGIGLVAYAHASTTLGSATGYAWGDQLGWINFGCTQCTVQVSNAAVTGYAWSSVAGWINLSPAHAGVVNDGNGTLSGYAWSSSLGWINFSGVSITGTGSFTGIAGTASSTAGRINFNCSYCNVTTDWRPGAQNQNPTNPSPSSGGGGGGTGAYVPFPTPGTSTAATVIASSAQTSSLQPIEPPPSSIAGEGAPSSGVTPTIAPGSSSSPGQYTFNANNGGSETLPTGSPLPAVSSSVSSSVSSPLSLLQSSSLLLKLFVALIAMIGVISFIIFSRRKKNN